MEYLKIYFAGLAAVLGTIALVGAFGGLFYLAIEHKAIFGAIATFVIAPIVVGAIMKEAGTI